MDYRTEKHLDNLEIIGTSSSDGSPEDDKALQDARSHYMIYGRRRKTKDDGSGPVPFGGLVLLAIGLGLYFNPSGTVAVVLYLGLLFLFAISLIAWPIHFLKNYPQYSGPALVGLVAFAFLGRNTGFAQEGFLSSFHYYSGGTPADGFLALLIVGLALLPWSPFLFIVLHMAAVRLSGRKLTIPEVGRGSGSEKLLAALAPLSMIALLVTWYFLTDNGEERTVKFFMFDDPLANVAGVFFLFGLYGLIKLLWVGNHRREDPMEDLRRRAQEQMEQEQEEAAGR